MKKYPLTSRRYDNSLSLTTALPYTLLIIVLNHGGHWSKKKKTTKKPNIHIVIHGLVEHLLMLH